MQLRDIVSAPWAITPEMWAEVQGIYARHVRGEKIDLSSIEAKVGAPLQNARQEMDVQSGVALISLEGVLAKRMNLFMRISGGASTQLITQQIAAAMADDSIRAIVLVVDSPGGTVDGTQQLADAVYDVRGKKPIVAYVDGCCCSAAYWVASAADHIYIDGDTAMVGSIGIIATHTDKSMADAQRGVRVTEITAGAYKTVGSPNAPLGAGESVLQAAVDHHYSVFLEAVARNRGVPVDTVKQDMADGRVFLGRQAIDAGLVDGVATLDQVIAQTASTSVRNGGALAISQADGAGVAQVANSQPEQSMDKLTVDKVRAEAPDVAKALIDEGISQGKAVGILEGAEAEQDRIQSIDALATPGHEALIKQLKADGKTSGPEAAVLILKAENEQRAARLASTRSDAAASAVAGAAAPEAGAAKQPAGNEHTLAKAAREHIAEQAKLGITVTAADAVAHVMNQKKEG